MTKKWIFIRRDMPPIERYCEVTSGYQSKVVEVLTKEGNEHFASLQLYGNSTDGWTSKWWEDGMLSKKRIVDVIGWRLYDFGLDYGGMTFEEMMEDLQK